MFSFLVALLVVNFYICICFLFSTIYTDLDNCYSLHTPTINLTNE